MERRETRANAREPRGASIRRWLAISAFLVLASSLWACGSEPTGIPDPTGTGDDIVDAGAGDTLLVRIRDGPDAGDHRRQGVQANCSIGLVPDAFGVQYSDVEVTEGLASLQVIVPGAAAAAGGVTDFQATAILGSLEEGSEYDITSGTAMVDVESESPTLTIEGTTADGTRVNIQVACGSVVGA
ncbi:MAG: hypothetical protein HY658_00190 [Actinobacteria bacterium]|nr:hypothetical protein [Actinomycetota bacterium]